jgi:hypothetical protein
LGLPYDFIDLEPGQDSVELEAMLDAAWGRIEARIAYRYTRRSLTVILRTDCSNEMVELPLRPVTIATAEIFQSSEYSPGSFLPGPTLSSVILPTAGTWRLTGTAGPSPAVQPPAAIKQAVKLLVAWQFENRGDIAHDFRSQGAFIGTGAADLIRPYVRVA